METIDIPHSNKKGEIWIQECACGKKRKAVFNNKGECFFIEPINKENKF